MSNPVTVKCPLSALQDIQRTLRECADDIRCNVEAEYPADLREKYPTYQRRYARDVEIVGRAQMLADAIGTWGVYQDDKH